LECLGSADGWWKEKWTRQFIRPVVVVIQKVENGGKVVERPLDPEALF
jgi:hypothetical protein